MESRTGHPGATGEHLGPAQLRELFLFEHLDDDQLAWVADHGDVVAVDAGAAVCRQGEPADCFWVLLDGALVGSQLVRGQQVETIRSSQRGAYVGSARTAGDPGPQTYPHTVRATTASSFLALPAERWGRQLVTWFPLAMHLMSGAVRGIGRTSAVLGERERLLALGSLSAGLTHELNNPAAAASRATAALRDRVAGMRHKLGMLADGRLDGALVAQLVELQEDAVRRAATAPELSALDAADAEDALGEAMADAGVEGAWDLAPSLVAAGLDAEWLDKLVRTVPAGSAPAAVRWIGYAVETEALMDEITDATGRIAHLVGAARQYSQLDRAPFVDADVRLLVKSTLVVMGGKLAGLEVVKDFDADLPPVACYAAELNQVWTNLVDNAVHAMGGAGVLTVSAHADAAAGVVRVGVSDTGPGIPDDVRPRIFEPFFTTKDVGEGTGLGLDISWRIVVERHHGDIAVQTGPGGTTFTVSLPLHP